MKWYSITLKTGRQLVRNRMALFFSLLFPLIFIILFGAAFGSFSGGHLSYDIAVINHDDGVVFENETINHGDNMADLLKKMKYQDSKGKNTSTHVFKLHKDMDEKEAQKAVENRDINAYVVIPHNFSEAVTAEAMRYIQSAISKGFEDQFSGPGINYSDPIVMQRIIGDIMANMSQLDQMSYPDHDENATATVIIQGDPGQSSYFTVSGIVKGMLKVYVEEVGFRTLEQAGANLPFDIDPGSQRPHVIIDDKALKASEFTAFDYQVPGIIVFALLMSSISISIFLAKEESKGTLTRLKLTKMSSFDLLMGTTVPFTILAVVQVLILLAVALMMGYHYHPDANLGLALFIGLWGCLATVALGLIIAAFAKDEDQAGNIAPALAVPLSFLTGAFFPMPSVVLTDDFFGTGRTFELFDGLPWTQCSKALAKVLTYGQGLEDILFELALMAIFTFILFFIGVVLYHKNRLRNI